MPAWHATKYITSQAPVLVSAQGSWLLHHWPRWQLHAQYQGRSSFHLPFPKHHPAAVTICHAGVLLPAEFSQFAGPMFQHLCR